MSSMIDGRFDDPDGPSKVFVRRRDDESADAFAERAMALLIMTGQIDPEDAEAAAPDTLD
jgi:hypothetical protein